MVWKKGDVLLIPFPYSDLSGVKVRPVVVVSIPAYQAIRGELLVAYLTSQVTALHPTFDYLLTDWRTVGLLKPTVMKPRLAVIKKTLVRYSIGKLSARDLAEVELRLRRTMDLM